MERETLKSRLGFIMLSAVCAIGIGEDRKSTRLNTSH